MTYFCTVMLLVGQQGEHLSSLLEPAAAVPEFKGFPLGTFLAYSTGSCSVMWCDV